MEYTIHGTVMQVLEVKLERRVTMRTAANILAIQRVVEATNLRGLYP